VADDRPALRPVDFDPFAPASAREAVLALTEPQAEIWTAAAMGPEANCSFNQCFAFELHGPLRVESLRAALDQAVARHEALRTVIALDGTSQTVRPPFSVDMPLIDLSAVDPAGQQLEFERALQQECETPFDLAEGPLVRAFVVRESADRHRFVLTVHHIVCDGWSSSVLFSDLGLLYAADCVGIPARLGPVASYREYIAARTSREQLVVAAADEEYWAAQYPSGAPILELPLARARPAAKTYRSGRVQLRVDNELYAAARKTGARSGATLFATLLAAYQALVYRLSGQSDFVVGIPFAEQPQLENSTLVAHCVNTVPLRARLDPAAPFAEQLRTVRQELADAQDHSRLTFGSLVRRLRIARDPSRTPLVAITFAMDKLGAPFDFGDVSIAALATPKSYSNFELMINIVDNGSELVVECDYNADLFDGPTVRRWLSHYESLLLGIVARPECALDALPILDDHEQLAVETGAGVSAFPQDRQLDMASEGGLPNLPFDRPESPGERSERGVVSRAVSGAAGAVERLAGDVGVSAERVALAAWVVVLAAYSGKSTVSVDVAADGAAARVEVDADSGLSFVSLAGLLSRSLDGSGSSAPVGPAVFVLEHGGGGFDAVASGASVALRLESGGGEDLLVASYDVGRFERSTVVRMLGHLETVLSQAMASGGAVKVGDVVVVPAAELALLQSWNATRVRWDGAATLVSLFGAVGGGSDAVAVQFGSRAVSYEEFERLARRVAGRLVELGVGRGSFVGVLCERSVELVAALHGVVMAGAAYVPLDPEYPPDRLDYMAGETGMRVVLCQGRLGGMIERTDVTMVDLERLLAGGAAGAGDSDFGPEAVDPDELAYVFYTSGSTGRPKGVANAHRGVANQLLWMQDRFGLGPGDVVLQKTPFSFDASVWEFFWPLQVGARLVIAEPGGHRDPAYLVQTIVRHGVNTIYFVPSMLRLFLEHPAAASCTSLRRVFCGGEALARDLQDRFFAVLPDAELHNLYGPTEAAIDVTAWQCRPDDSRRVVPIGAPIANTTIHILNDRLQPVPIGIPGELHIGGVQVAVGYVNRPELTAQAFIPDPFDPPGRLYKTGDLARWLPDGQVDYLGRLDHQIKLRGQRIELGEIEAVLRQHPAVTEVVVVAREDRRGDQRLVAYLTPSSHASSGLVETLRSELRRTLPEYMVPSHFVSVAAIPLAPNGKVDKKSLPAPDWEAVTTGTQHVAPRTPTESRLATIWADALGIASPGVHDDFFDLGGHSLEAAQVVITLRSAFQLDIAMRHLFERPTIAALAEIIDVLAVSAGNGGRQRDDARSDREEIEI
jgi:amino acid adenylation domain-containing protein